MSPDLEQSIEMAQQRQCLGCLEEVIRSGGEQGDVREDRAAEAL